MLPCSHSTSLAEAEQGWETLSMMMTSYLVICLIRCHQPERRRKCEAAILGPVSSGTSSSTLSNTHETVPPNNTEACQLLDKVQASVFSLGCPVGRKHLNYHHVGSASNLWKHLFIYGRCALNIYF